MLDVGPMQCVITYSAPDQDRIDSAIGEIDAWDPHNYVRVAGPADINIRWYYGPTPGITYAYRWEDGSITADVYVNPTFKGLWFRRLMQHEFMHGIGFGHSSNPASAMYPYLYAGPLGAVDIAALQRRVC